MSANFSKPVMPRAINPLLADAATIERFIAHCHRRKYPARTDVFRPGDAAGTLYYIMSGSVSIIASEDDGRELVLGYIGPGEFVGARQSGVPLLRYADLEMDADLVEMARDIAEEMLTGHPEMAERHLKRWLGSREELLKS